jgi:hypothetical protein
MGSYFHGFFTGLPNIIKQHDAIMVVVEKLIKESHFIPIKSTFKSIEIANVFIKEIFKFHGFPKTTISDRDDKLTSNFWKNLFVGLDTHLAFSTTYHPQTDGQTERVKKILEDMLRMHVMH